MKLRHMSDWHQQATDAGVGAGAGADASFSGVFVIGSDIGSLWIWTLIYICNTLRCTQKRLFMDVLQSHDGTFKTDVYE